MNPFSASCPAYLEDCHPQICFHESMKAKHGDWKNKTYLRSISYRLTTLSKPGLAEVLQVVLVSQALSLHTMSWLIVTWQQGLAHLSSTWITPIRTIGGAEAKSSLAILVSKSCSNLKVNPLSMSCPGYLQDWLHKICLHERLHECMRANHGDWKLKVARKVCYIS